MTVFLGNNGRITLRRTPTAEAYRTVVNDADVTPSVNRFSVDFAHEQLITGDYLEIKTVGGEDITWIDDSTADSAFSRYCHIDEAGGIRLYNTFQDALEADSSKAIKLQLPGAPQECTIKVGGAPDARCLAQVTKYQITTSRNTIDTTHLGAHYRKQYEAGLIQGQGQIECLWEDQRDCDVGPDNREFSGYLARLCIRLVHGASFEGQFYVYADETLRERSVWYESQACVVTNVAIAVETGQLIRSTIDFVTNGPIALREGFIPAVLELEESEFDIALEGDDSDGNIALEDPD